MRRLLRSVWICTTAAVALSASPCLGGQLTVISDVMIEETAEGTSIRLSADGPVKYLDFTLTDPDRIVVDCFDAARTITSEKLPGPGGSGISAVRVSQYRLQPRPITRAVVDLDHPAPYIIKPLEDGLMVIVNPVQTAEPRDLPAVLEVLEGLGMPLVLAKRVEGPLSGELTAGPEVGDDLITIDFQDAEIGTVLRSFGEYSGVNIVAGPEVKGLVTVHLEDVPWREALDIVLKANGFSYVTERGVIRVGGAQAMANEEITRQAAARKREELLPLESRVIRIKFANAEEIREPLRNILTSRGSIEVEPRTNTILVTDIASTLERIEKLVAELDTRTAQVEINARLVDMDASVSRELGIDWTALQLTTPSISAEGEVIISAPVYAPVGQFTVGKIKGPNGTLDATLTALEKENKASIISNPRITTLDNMEAKILVGKKIPLIVSDEAGNPITELTTIGIQMTVTPHVNADGQITLELHPEVSDLAAQATVQGGIIILTSEARTRVMVKDGETVVIGGLIRKNETEYVTGVPLLRSLPLVGRFFRSMSTTLEERELLVFVTPRIVS